MLLRILFLIIATLTTFVLSFLTAKVYALGLRLGTQATRILTILSLVAPLFFISSMVLGRVFKNTSFTYSYTSSAIGGILFYFFGVAVLLGIIMAFSPAPLPLWIAWSALIISTLLSLGGLLQARFIKTTSYTVPLENAPSSWNGKRAVLLSDTHFGTVNHKKFSDKIIKKIQSINPDFVLHAGDFYDGPDNNTARITDSWTPLAQQFPVFYAPGNHEEYGNYAAFITSIKNADITVLENQKVLYDGVQIAGITYFAKNQSDEAARAIELLGLDTSAPAILINHPPTFHKTAEAEGVDLMVSGHTHKGQFWPLNYIVKAIYGKFFYGLQLYGTLTGITTSGVGTAGPPMRLFNTPEIVVITFSTKDY